jgi:hypothetical protein
LIIIKRYINKLKIYENLNNSSKLWRNYLLFIEIIKSISKIRWGVLMNIEVLRSVKKEIFINMEQEILTGNILDIGKDHHGIVYSLFKQYNDETSVEYVSGKENKELIKKREYDSCVLFFSLSNIWLKYNKRKLIKDIYEFLRENGTIYIWDIDKGYSSFFYAKVKLSLPERKIKEISVRDLNPLKDNSKNSMIKLLQEYFEIVDSKSSDNIYFIKGRKISNISEQKKGRSDDESGTDRDKFKVRSQQFGNKILEGIHKRFKL